MLWQEVEGGEQVSEVDDLVLELGVVDDHVGEVGQGLLLWVECVEEQGRHDLGVPVVLYILCDDLFELWELICLIG